MTRFSPEDEAKCVIMEAVAIFFFGTCGHGVRDGKRSMEKERVKPKHASSVACVSKTAKLIRSLRDDVRVMSQETGTCKWLRAHDESEWSLMTSLIRRFWFPYEQAAGRSLREMCRSWSPCLDQVLLQSTKPR